MVPWLLHLRQREMTRYLKQGSSLQHVLGSFSGRSLASAFKQDSPVQPGRHLLSRFNVSRRYAWRYAQSCVPNGPVVSRVPKVCRSYYVDARGYEHFSKRGFGGSDGDGRRKKYTLIFISGLGIFTVTYLSHQEVVPYTFRSHFVLLSPDFEMKLVENQYESLKKQWAPDILPPLHPQAMRVRRIAQDIIRAVMEGTKMEEWENVQIKYNGKVHSHMFGDREMPVMIWSSNDAEFPASSQFAGDHEGILNDRWVDESRSKGLKKGKKPYVEHLKKMKWEVLVVDKNIVNAFCLPGGKIVVFTGLLKRFPRDAEIATVMGHEVAHVVARHSAERMTRHLFVVMMEIAILAFFYAPDLIRTASVLLLELPFSRSQELEADHIGLLLMAAAGYDPRVAPHLYEKLGELAGSSELLQYVTTHPSGKTRGERLKKTGTMEEALHIYEQRTRGVFVEGFL